MRGDRHCLAASPAAAPPSYPCADLICLFEYRGAPSISSACRSEYRPRTEPISLIQKFRARARAREAETFLSPFMHAVLPDRYERDQPPTYHRPRS